jgi:hypothetical protein
MAVEALNRLLDGASVGELDEGEPAGAAAHPVRGQEYFHDLTHLGEELLELALGRFVAQVSNEYLGGYDVLLW